jgi:hypothetical protein
MRGAVAAAPTRRSERRRRIMHKLLVEARLLHAKHVSVGTRERGSRAKRAQLGERRQQRTSTVSRPHLYLKRVVGSLAKSLLNWPSEMNRSKPWT